MTEMGFWDKRRYLGQKYGEWLNIPIIYLLSGWQLSWGNYPGVDNPGGYLWGAICLWRVVVQGAIVPGELAGGVVQGAVEWGGNWPDTSLRQ